MMEPRLPKDEVLRTHQEICRLNLGWLIALRELAQRSPAEAVLRFGVSPQLVDEICEAATDVLQELANSDRLKFKPVFDVADLREAGDAIARQHMAIRGQGSAR